MSMEFLLNWGVGGLVKYERAKEKAITKSINSILSYYRREGSEMNKKVKFFINSTVIN